jgi:hypothetical protein
MRIHLFFAILFLAATSAIAQTQPPTIVFFDEVVMSETRALEVAEVTRQRFWGRVPGYDGKPIQPTSEDERLSIPLPTWDLLYIAQSASLAGDAARCKVNTADEHLLRLQNSFRPKYRDEKRVQFAFAYSILIFRDVTARLKDTGCSMKHAEDLRKGIAFIAK